MPTLRLWRKKGIKGGATNATAAGPSAPRTILQSQARPQDGYVRLWTKAFESLAQGTEQDQEDSQRLEDLFGIGAQYTSCTGEDVLANLLLESQKRTTEANEKSWKVQIGTRIWSLRDVTDNIVTLLGKFKEVGDVAVSFDPGHAALPWAAFRFLLQISLRCRIYEKLYLDSNFQGQESSKALESSIITVFKYVLTFLATASASVTNEQGFKKAVASITAPERFTCKLASITKLEKEVEIAADNCHRETSRESQKSFETAHQSLLGLLVERFSRLDDTVTSIWTTVADDDRQHMLRWISQVPYQSDLENITSTRLDGTCEWLIAHPQYGKWRLMGASTVLWLHGIPGAGKTRLTSKVVEDVINTTSMQESVAYFFCDRGQDRREPLSVLQSLVRQLTCSRSGNQVMPCMRAKYMEKKNHGFASNHLTLDECRELLAELTSLYAQSTFIIDGLDECDEKTCRILMEAIDWTLAKSPRLVKVFIASRDDQDIKEQYGGGENLNIRASHNQGDINIYVQTRMEQTKWCRERMSRQTKDKIQEIFRKKSNGMFQWAALHINDLLELKSEALVSNYLNALPEGLAATYAQIYNSIDKRKRHVFDRAFQWMIGSWDELTPEELEVAVSQQFDTPFSPKVEYDIDFIIATCKNLIQVVTVSGSSKRTCQFVHLSVREYFEEHHWPPQMANDLVLRTYIRYCTHSLKGNSGVHPLWVNKMQRWDKQCASFQGRCSPETLELLLVFLGHPMNSSSSYRAWARSFDGITEQPIDTERHKECWSHCLNLGLHDVTCTWLRKGDLDPNARDADGSTVLGIAVKAGRRQICETLLAAGADASLATEYSMNALEVALWLGGDHLDIARLLVTNGVATQNPGGGYYGRALHAAVIRGYTDILKLMLEHGADPNTTSPLYGTALRAAAYGCHIEVCKLLIEAGADVNLGDNLTPLAVAVSNEKEGGEALTELLLSAGADINARDDDGTTPLHKAVKREGDDGVSMAKLLIARGPR
ncbi:ankyrin repeat-containing protein [Apiospora rasikravindrae]|uniref:Ankyrin repeat-containing protein n=1 Tax=Apiospora rasikravindrae TaxID=990691 RepID=A0ABR1RX95_9PEZI